MLIRGEKKPNFFCFVVICDVNSSPFKFLPRTVSLPVNFVNHRNVQMGLFILSGKKKRLFCGFFGVSLQENFAEQALFFVV